MRRVVVNVLLSALLLSLTTNCGGRSADETLTGKVTLSAGNYTGPTPEVGAECVGSGGYDDLAEGAQVTIRNQDGTTIASGQLDAGEILDPRTRGPGCEFSFEIAELPDAEFYEVEVSHRGELTYSKQELEKNNYHVELSIGD